MSEGQLPGQQREHGDVPEQDPPAGPGPAARLLAEEGLGHDLPLRGALHALERLGNTPPPDPTGRLAELLAGTGTGAAVALHLPSTQPECTVPGGEADSADRGSADRGSAEPGSLEPGRTGPGSTDAGGAAPGTTVLPFLRGSTRRAAAGGTLVALALVAGLGGAAAASPALRGQFAQVISAVVPVAVEPGGVEIDRAQLGSVPFPPPAEPADGAGVPQDDAGGTCSLSTVDGRAPAEGASVGTDTGQAGAACGDAGADDPAVDGAAVDGAAVDGANAPGGRFARERSAPSGEGRTGERNGSGGNGQNGGNGPGGERVRHSGGGQYGNGQHGGGQRGTGQHGNGQGTGWDRGRGSGPGQDHRLWKASVNGGDSGLWGGPGGSGARGSAR